MAGEVGGTIFVVQKHDASRLHYDFRLEVDGVLKSWAIPKGPSTDPQEKRLAVPTEDHPLEYAGFEGVIPAESTAPARCWSGTPASFAISPRRRGWSLTSRRPWATATLRFGGGAKLKGGYGLTRFKTGKDEAWLLAKADDQEADASADLLRTRPESVLSGRTLEEIARGRKKE